MGDNPSGSQAGVSNDGQNRPPTKTKDLLSNIMASMDTLLPSNEPSPDKHQTLIAMIKAKTLVTHLKQRLNMLW